jgi:hypothetical protein
MAGSCFRAVYLHLSLHFISQFSKKTQTDGINLKYLSQIDGIISNILSQNDGIGL